MKKSLLVMLCLVLAIAMVFVGCDKADTTTDTGSDDTAAADDTSAADDTADDTDTVDDGGDDMAAADKISMVFIPKNLGNPYFEAIEKGFYDAMAELGEDNFEFLFTGPATAEATSQIEYVEAAVQNGADIIFIAANSNDALNGTFDDARAAGTKIVIINQDIPGSEDRRDGAILPTNFANVGKAQIKLLSELMGGAGEFAILSATTDAPDQNVWIADIQDEVENNADYANMTLVEVVYGDDQPEKSTTEMEALLTKYPDLGGVIAPTTVGVAAAAKVIQNKGIADQVKLTGLGLPSEMEEFILDGTCEAMQLWNPPYEGYLATYLAYEMAMNGFEIAEGASFSAGKLGDYTFGADNILITLEDPMTYDPSNIEEYAALF